MQRGNYAKAVEAIVPKFIRDPIKAGREAAEGITSYSGEPLMDTTAAPPIMVGIIARPRSPPSRFT